jgi:NADPH2 dehydrogenase
MQESYTKIAGIKSAAELRQCLAQAGLTLPVDDQIQTAEQRSPLSAPIHIGSFQVGNRWCIHPMEGWDGNPDGSPSELTFRRWEHFGQSGAKLIWGGEATAVQPDGRANPRQLLATPENQAALTQLLDHLRVAHDHSFSHTDDLLVGLQLTHSGRFSRPHSSQLEPRIAYHHPLLDKKFGIDPDNQQIVWTDDDLLRLIDRYVDAAQLAYAAGFHFVDVKACHGYLLHEFLSARTRSGPFGGDFAGRTRLLKTIIRRITERVPELMICVRLSVFDTLPYEPGPEVGQPLTYQHLLPYEFGFGVNPDDPLQYDLTEPIRLLRELHQLGVAAVNISCGSPYYNPHIQRPAAYPPSDGYRPPEDPLIGVARLIQAARDCKQAVPELPMVGSGYTYLQDYVPHVAQAIVRQGWIDLVGIGRMVLSYPRLPADSLEQGRLERRHICRTFSDCTTAPRHGMVSGCYPLDAHYKSLPEHGRLKQIKAQEE